jgi:hypothetical protein
MLIVVVFLSMNHFLDETGLNQKRQGAIYRCFRDSAPFLSKAIGKFFGLEVAFHGRGLLKDPFPFRRPLQADLLKVA